MSLELAKLHGGEPFSGDAVALFQLVYKSPAFGLSERMLAAKEAAPFERSKLSSVAMSGELNVDIGRRLDRALEHKQNYGQEDGNR